jgi:hypothetical protein
LRYGSDADLFPLHGATRYLDDFDWLLVIQVAVASNVVMSRRLDYFARLLVIRVAFTTLMHLVFAFHCPACPARLSRLLLRFHAAFRLGLIGIAGRAGFVTVSMRRAIMGNGSFGLVGRFMGGIPTT